MLSRHPGDDGLRFSRLRIGNDASQLAANCIIGAEQLVKGVERLQDGPQQSAISQTWQAQSVSSLAQEILTSEVLDGIGACRLAH